jgi:hypothetical protein
MAAVVTHPRTWSARLFTRAPMTARLVVISLMRRRSGREKPYTMPDQGVENDSCKIPDGSQYIGQYRLIKRAIRRLLRAQL